MSASGKLLRIESATKWGLYDTVDGLWMGDDEGPATYTEYMIARVAAQVVDEQLGQEPGRTEAKEYIDGSKRIRDTVHTRMGVLQALRNLEGGKS